MRPIYRAPFPAGGVCRYMGCVTSTRPPAIAAWAATGCPRPPVAAGTRRGRFPQLQARHSTRHQPLELLGGRDETKQSCDRGSKQPPPGELIPEAQDRDRTPRCSITFSSWRLDRCCLATVSVARSTRGVTPGQRLAALMLIDLTPQVLRHRQAPRRGAAHRSECGRARGQQ